MYKNAVLIAVILCAAHVPVIGGALSLTDKLSVELDGVPLVDALRMIAAQNNLNLVISGEVVGTVSLRLENVDIVTALEAIITGSGHNYFVNDDVIVVKPADQVVTGELVSRTLTLKYVNPVTAKKALSTRTSDRGEVVILDKTDEGGSDKGRYQANRILITDRFDNIDELVALVTELDVEERLVLIEAKIIETKIDDVSKLGFLWPSSLGADLGGADDVASETNSSSSFTASDSKAGWYDPSNGAWTWGKLSVRQVNAILDLLDREGNSRLVSDPRITTMENHEAEIRIETVIPIQTINRFSEGAVIQDIVTFQDEEIGISLKVIPRINEDRRITLQVSPKVEDIIGYSGPPDNQKPITTSRSITTSITVEDGETIALGGLFKEDEIEVEHKVPLLGHIPLIGKLLFTNTSVEKSTTDLTILITPKILN
jgi:type II secretory pathway component GspD/PulD (secretin)